MNTHSRPSRGSTDERGAHGAVDGDLLLDVLLALPAGLARRAGYERLRGSCGSGTAATARTDRVARRTDGRSASSHGSEPSGRRKPAGESPGTSCTRPARVDHRSERQRRRRSTAVPALHRQHERGRRVQPAPERAREPRAFLGIVELGIERRDVFRQRRFFVDERARVFVGGRHERRIDVDPLRDAARERRGILACVGFGVGRFARDAVGIVPQRQPVAAPIQRERPARQRLAGIPFALTVVQQAAGGKAVAQASNERIAERALRRSDRGGRPLLGVHVVDRNERRLAAHRQPHVAFAQRVVDAVAERDRSPTTARRCTAW